MTKPKIYTRTGDQGKTSLVDGQRVEKTDLRLHAYGSVDELNSSLGLARSAAAPHWHEKNQLANWIVSLQHRLFNVGSLLACDSAEVAKQLPSLSADDVALLEKQIDEMEAELPELREFILPGGSPFASHLHLARTICRRTERLTLQLNEQKPVPKEILLFLNRMSDYLFVAARFANHRDGVAETVWSKSQDSHNQEKP